MHSRKWTQVSPTFRHSSHPRVCGCTSRISSMCVQPSIARNDSAFARCKPATLESIVFRFAVLPILLCGAAIPVCANTTAADLAREISQAGIDPSACYRVTDLNFSKEDVRIYLTSGYIAFTKPVHGVRTAAVFSTDVEGGDAEVLLMPPYRSERLSLANFTESPNLDEHFRSAIMVFSDSTAGEIEGMLRAKSAKKSDEIGALLADKADSTVRNLTESFAVRLVGDLLSPSAHGGFFYMGVLGTKLGNFDIMHDPRSREQIVAGRLSYRDERPYFDTWTSFPGRAVRMNPSLTPVPPIAVQDFRIDTTILPDFSMRSTVAATFKVENGEPL